MMAQDDITTARKRWVELELRAHGIGTQDPFGQFLSLVDAFHQVLTAAPHENRLSSTGVVLFSHHFQEYETQGVEFVPYPSNQEHLCWGYADGVHSFVAKDPSRVGLLFPKMPVIDEMSLFSLRDDLLFDEETGPSDAPLRECIIIQRSTGHSARRLTVLARERIVTYSGLAYLSKPYQYAIMRELRRVIAPFPWSQSQTLKSALRVAVHKLSPENVGATLVVLTTSDEEKVASMIASDQLVVNAAVEPRECLVTSRKYQRPLATLIGQRDGATIISATGNVIYVGAFFGSRGREGSEGSGERSAEYGTRHRSAAEFSKWIDGLALVVSSDGPVTVFRKGNAIPIPM